MPNHFGVKIHYDRLVPDDTRSNNRLKPAQTIRELRGQDYGLARSASCIQIL